MRACPVAVGTEENIITLLNYLWEQEPIAYRGDVITHESQESHLYQELKEGVGVLLRVFVEVLFLVFILIFIVHLRGLTYGFIIKFSGKIMLISTIISF